MQIFLFFALFISVLAVVFAVQNNAPVTVAFAAWNYSGSLALVLLVTLLVGALISFFFSLPSNIKTRWTLRQQRKKITEMDTKMADLKNKLELAVKEGEKNSAIMQAPLLEFAELSEDEKTTASFEPEMHPVDLSENSSIEEQDEENSPPENPTAAF